MSKWLLSIVVVLTLVAFVSVSAEEAQRTYVGASKCRICHKKPDVGEQYTIWQKSKHANAYAVLAGDEAKAIAKKKGIADPQKAAECLQCHVTGYGVAAEYLGPKYDPAEGVTCEACHGAGGDYYKKKTMVGVISGEIDGATVGLRMPTEKLCKTCHNEKSPTFKAFNYDEMFKKIAHPIPAERKAMYKKG